MIQLTTTQSGYLAIPYESLALNITPRMPAHDWLLMVHHNDETANMIQWPAPNILDLHFALLHARWGGCASGSLPPR